MAKQWDCTKGPAQLLLPLTSDAGKPYLGESNLFETPEGELVADPSLIASPNLEQLLNTFTSSQELHAEMDRYRDQALGPYPINWKYVSPDYRLEDEKFLSALNLLRAHGGGVTLYLDCVRDTYGDREHLMDTDLDYHYALVGVDLVNIPPQLFGDFCSLIMPLPLLCERLGFVVEEYAATGDETNGRVSLDFTQLVSVMMELFHGRVRLGLRYDWAKLYSQFERDRDYPHTPENISKLTAGPLIPRDRLDGNRVTELMEWLAWLQAELTVGSDTNAGHNPDFQPAQLLRAVLPEEA